MVGEKRGGGGPSLQLDQEVMGSAAPPVGPGLAALAAASGPRFGRAGAAGARASSAAGPEAGAARPAAPGQETVRGQQARASAALGRVRLSRGSTRGSVSSGCRPRFRRRPLIPPLPLGRSRGEPRPALAPPDPPRFPPLLAALGPGELRPFQLSEFEPGPGEAALRTRRPPLLGIQHGLPEL